MSSCTQSCPTLRCNQRRLPWRSESSFTLASQGGSPTPHGLAVDVSRAWAWMEETAGIGARLVLYGHSLGSALAVRAAAASCVAKNANSTNAVIAHADLPEDVVPLGSVPAALLLEGAFSSTGDRHTSQPKPKPWHWHHPDNKSPKAQHSTIVLTLSVLALSPGIR